MDGWIKLHRKAISNEVFRFDRTAWFVFETLLLVADKKTGKYSAGLLRFSEWVGLPKSTAYKALRRLESAKMIKRHKRGNYTIYEIVNWKEYQGGSDGGSKKTEYGNEEVNRAFEMWFEIVGYEIKQRKNMNRRSAYNLIRSLGLDKLREALIVVSASQGDKYAPNISDFVDLASNIDKLRVWAKKQANQRKGVIKI